jgi:predicted RNase H-like HicB family nuclease
MSVIKIVIEKTSNFYSAYSENVEGIYGAGATVQKTKESVLKSLELYVKYNKKKLPKILQGDYSVKYRFDTQSLLNYYKGIFTNASLEKITGINQKQIQHYASGLKKPRELQKRKIQTGLRNLAKELQSIEL